MLQRGKQEQKAKPPGLDGGLGKPVGVSAVGGGGAAEESSAGSAVESAATKPPSKPFALELGQVDDETGKASKPPAPTKALGLGGADKKRKYVDGGRLRSLVMG